jgi:hypothetical protein
MGEKLRVPFRAMDAKSMFEQRLSAFAKNLCAISEGRGSPGTLIDDSVSLAEAILAFNEAFGTRPGEELIRRALASLHEEE